MIILIDFTAKSDEELRGLLRYFTHTREIDREYPNYRRMFLLRVTDECVAQAIEIEMARREIAASVKATTTKRTIKEFEMAVTGISSEEWDRQALEAQEARAAIRAEYEAELYAKYDASELVIGCEEAPQICYGNSSEPFARNTPYHTWPESSIYQRGLYR